MTAPGRPLEGRVVLLTRTSSRAGSLVERLETLGARVETRPTILLEHPSDRGPAREAVIRLEQYDWVVFTSANGVRFFAELLLEIHGAETRAPGSVAAIGPATAAALLRMGWQPEIVTRDSRSEGLAESLVGRVVAGDRVLVVRPESARPVLPRAIAGLGARADAVAFYRNVAHPDIDGITRDLCADRFDVLLFSSPSSLERLLDSRSQPTEELLAALGRTRLVAIGPVTGRAIERAGLGVAAVAAEPTDESIEYALSRLFD